MTRRVPLLALLGLAVGVAGAPSPAPGCAAAPPPGGRVEIASEEAIIIWDEATKTEHFIRRANFRSTSADFGFLVPTPSKPELAEAPDGAFDYLARLTEPKVEYRTVRLPRRRGEHGASDATAAAPGERGRGVEVLGEKQVAGLDAVILRFRRGEKDEDPAAGAQELADWLAKRGFAFGPTLVAWLKPYIANDWVMTAFRIAATKADAGRPRVPGAPEFHGVRGAAVRMSFTTDRPFYPYREPVEEKQPALGDEPRLLRVYFIAEKRYEGTLGEGTAYWPGRTAWADRLADHQTRTLGDGQFKFPGPGKGVAWLTEFEDHSTPRPGTDEVYFKPAASQEPVARPPIVHDVVEWYDAPEPEREVISESTALLLMWVVIGLGVLGLTGRLLYGMIHRK